MKTTPLERWLVVGNSVIIIGISAALAGLAVSGIVSWNVCSMLGGMVVLPFPLAVGGLQYAAGFRQNARAAKVVGIIHLVACAVFGFGWIANTSECIFEKGSLTWDQCSPLLILLCIATYCGICAWINLRVGKYLRAATAEGGLPVATGAMGRYQFTLRELLGGIVIVSIMASVASYTIRLEGKQYAEHVTREEAPVNVFQLPEDVTDVCYCRRCRGSLAYEFTIDEAGFHNWAKNRLEYSPSNSAASIDKIQKGNPFTIERYTSLMPEPSSIENETATITQGYFYELWWQDEGLKLAYDSVNQRAYFYRY